MNIIQKNWTLLMPLLLGGVMLKVLHFEVAVALFIAYFILFLNKQEKAVVCVFSLCKILGFGSLVYGFHIQGTLLALLLVLLLLRTDLLFLFHQRWRKPWFYSIVLIFILSVIYYLSEQTEVSHTRISNTIINFVVYVIGFWLLADGEEIRTDRIAPIFLLETILWFAFTITFFPFFEPKGILDFNYFRDTCSALKHEEVISISYHTVGIASFFATALYLSSKRNLESIFDYIFLITCAWGILLSGARQAFFGYVMLIGLWLYLKKGRYSLVTFCGILLLFLIVYLGLQYFEIDTFKIFFEESRNLGGNLNRDYNFPFILFSQHPIWGVGFGNYYNPQTDEVYPHNIILEMLCEYGIVGSVIVMLPCIVFLLTTKSQIIKLSLGDRITPIILWFPFFIRSMISGDISGNIAVFIGLFFLFNSYNRNLK